MAQKERTWNEVAEEFNSTKGTNRTGKMLKNKWEALKKATKLEYSNIKTSAKRTGGGVRGGFKLGGLGERVLGIVGIGITGTSNLYDCDNIENMELVFIDDAHNGPNENTHSVNNNNIEENTWDHWSPALLKQPLVPALQVESARKEVNKENGVCNEDIEVEKKTETRKNKKSHTKNANRKLQKRITNKEREYNAYEALAIKESKLVDLQIETLLEEQKQRKEKHDLEMKILGETFAEDRKRINEKHALEIRILKEKLNDKN